MKNNYKKTNKNDAQVGAEDFKKIRLTIKKYARLLSDNYQFYLNSYDKTNLLEDECLRILFRKYLKKQEEEYLVSMQIVSELENKESIFDQYISSIKNNKEKVIIKNEIKLGAWIKLKPKLFEWLCLILLLHKYCSSQKGAVSIFLDSASNIPIPANDGARNIYLWYQHKISKTISGLDAIPDIVITNSNIDVTKDTILSIIECKCTNSFSSSVVRNEFGKAFDLEVGSYIIFSYYCLTEKIINALTALNLDVIIFGLHTKNRESFLDNSLSLGLDISNRINTYYEKNNFSINLIEQSKNISGKMQIEHNRTIELQ